jgi:F-type H+-transporting ATPase subunit gamma
MRPYAEKLTELLQNLSATLEGDARRIYYTWSEKSISWLPLLLIEVCGAFNSNVIGS